MYNVQWILTQCGDKSTEYCNYGSQLWGRTKDGIAPPGQCQCCRLHRCWFEQHTAGLVELRGIPYRSRHDWKDKFLHLKSVKNKLENHTIQYPQQYQQAEEDSTRTKNLWHAEPVADDYN